MKKVYAFIADGSEEVECLAVVDILKRGGAEVVLTSVGGKTVVGSHGIKIIADTTFDECDFSDADALFLPGGMPGTKNLAAHKGLCNLLLSAKDVRLAAICAAPSVLGRLGLLRGKTATCFPGFEEELIGAKYSPVGVVTDGNITTARGLGFAVDLGLELLGLLEGKATAEKVKSAIQHP